MLRIRWNLRLRWDGKVVLCLLLIGGATPAFRAAAADCSAAAVGLVSWWPGTGSANDIAVTRPGDLKGGAKVTASGVVGQAFSFDDSNACVHIPNAPGQQPTNVTIEAWVRFNSQNAKMTGQSA
jgi:hypothetical protein